MHREDLGYVPVWEGPIKRYAMNYLRKQKWRFDSLYTEEDLLQEGFMTFLKVKNAYPRVFEAPHFMSLFKVSLRRDVDTLTLYRQKEKTFMVEVSQDAYDFYEQRLSTPPSSDMGLLLQELPPAVRAALGVFNDPEKLRELQEELTRTKRMRRVKAEVVQEKFSEQLCRLAGVRNVNVKGHLKKL